jgi:hypothetical protein
MRLEIEKRLHRVGIRADKKKVKCPFSNKCKKTENCYRCNEFYTKCTIYKKNYFK